MLVGLRIHFSTLHEVLQESQGFTHILAESCQPNGDATAFYRQVVAARQLIELLLHLLGCQRVGANQFEIGGGIVVAGIHLVAEIIAEGELEASILCVLDGNHRQSVVHGRERQVFLEIDEARLDGLHLYLLNVLHKLADSIAIGGDGRYLRFVNLLLVGVYALTLIDGNIVVAEVALGEIHNLFFGHTTDAVEALHRLLPRLVINEGLQEHAGAPYVILHSLIVVQLQIIDDAGQQVVAEVAFLQLLQLVQQQGTHFVECLALTGYAHQLEGGIVHQLLRARTGLQHLHLLVDVQVQ